MTTRSVAIVTAVYGNAPTLPELFERLATALGGRSYRWRLRFVVDASPDDSLAVAHRLAQADDRIGVTALSQNVGQNRALTRGLAAEEDATAWVCVDADLQDPPEVVPMLLDHLAADGVGAVFGGRRGSYESMGRRLTGTAHRLVVNRAAGVPRDAGAFVAMGPEARAAVLRLDGPSLVAAIGLSGVRSVSVPVERSRRPEGRSAWTSSARLRQSARTVAWVARHRACAGSHR